jgi:predicted aminopeptidase
MSMRHLPESIILPQAPSNKGGRRGIWLRARRTVGVSLLLLTAALGSGCATVSYYSQAIGGHFDLLNRARPIDEWLADPALTPALRERLVYAAEARAYAARELGLPDNDSYRRYADLGRPFAVWNVFATPELSLKAREWCFPVVGCVSYRGFFSRERAQAFAAELRAEGHDVYVAGVAAYSTLGWFDDPLTNAMLARPLPEVAGLVFHELAHQRLYVRDDTTFNESFATVVELEGVRQWLAARGAGDQYAAYVVRHERRLAFNKLLLQQRAKLEKLYAAGLTDDQKRAGKRAIFDDLRREYARLDAGGMFDRWMQQDLNNAHLASVGLYHGQVEAMRALLARRSGDMRAFYDEMTRLAALPKADRLIALAAPPAADEDAR